MRQNKNEDINKIIFNNNVQNKMNIFISCLIYVG
jgi:hypothetical protein